MICFLRDRKTGKYYRGAKLWRWCKSWRNAALLPDSHFLTFTIPMLIKRGMSEENLEFVDLEHIDLDETP